MKTLSTKELNRLSKQYIIDAIDGENYGVELNSTEEKLRFLADTFKSEYGWQIERIGPVNAFREWLMGLPSAINIEFRNYEIIQIAKEWGSIPQDATEKQEEKILDNWFNLIAVKTFQLFRKYNIEV